MKRIIPLLIAGLMVLSLPALAQQGLGKGGGGGNGGGSGGSGGGNSGGSGGGQNGGSKGGGGSPPPPVRGGGGSGGSGGGNGGGNSGGGGQNGGSKGGNGGGQNPPVRGGGSGGGSGGNSGGNSAPPVRGGGNSGGGNSNPPVRGGGSNSGGNSAPPVRGGQNQGGNGGGLNKGGGNEAPPVGRTNSDDSRSGRVNYGGSNNQAGRTQRAPDFAPPPIVRSDDRNSREARGEDRVGRSNGNYRNGYYQYNNQWRDNNFWYPHYQFNYSDNCVPSPWYGYSNMPAYISIVRVRFDNFSFEWRTGDSYRWQYRDSRDWGGWDWGRNDRNSIDDAVDDIYDAFRQGRMRTMENLIPTRDTVWIELDRYSSYRISGDDFYDLMEDLIEGTWTRDYRIREVRRNGRQATVIAEHSYVDSWGRNRTSTHYYGLEEDRRGYKIVAFRVDD